MSITGDPDVLDVLGAVASGGFAGGLLGYLAAAAAELLGRRPAYEELVLHASMLGGWGTAAFIAFDQLRLQ